MRRKIDKQNKKILQEENGDLYQKHFVKGIIPQYK